MTRILALDTATHACSVALQDDDRLWHRFEMAAQSHTRRLLPMVDAVLAESGLSLGDLDALAFGRGPGSFTGLRIGLGVIQGLAFARNLPVVGVSTLDAMALGWWHHHPEDRERPLLVALDARMQEVYWHLAEWDPEPHCLTRCAEESVSSPEAVLAHPVVEQHRETLIGVGPGWHYPELAALRPEASQECLPDARFMLPLARRDLDLGRAVSAEQAQPVYLRNDISWKKRERIRRRDQ